MRNLQIFDDTGATAVEIYFQRKELRFIPNLVKFDTTNDTKTYRKHDKKARIREECFVEMAMDAASATWRAEEEIVEWSARVL